MKLNLGCGFKKKSDFVNVDRSKTYEPNVIVDLVKDTWPWEDSSVTEVWFEFSLEQMGSTVEDLKKILCELYRVCGEGAAVKIFAFHPRHDDFVLNPLCVHRLSPQFFSYLSLQGNLQQIANGQLGNSLSFEWGVNFEMSLARPHLSLHLKEMVEAGHLSEIDLQEKLLLENNICHVMEFDLKVVKLSDRENKR
ncbi:MAG: hypothetical protein AB7H97_03430 [Pseudobdellovibrionaceae bacterium]